VTINTYDQHGELRRLDPCAMKKRTCCILCGAPVVMIGVAIPNTPEMVAVIMRIRTHAVTSDMTPAMAYGLCADHAIEPDLDQINAVICEMAERVIVQ
jgi:hypothetical protein